MAVMEYIDAIRLAMKEEMERDESVFVLGEDVGVKGGVFTTTKGLMDQFGEMRVLDTRSRSPRLPVSLSERPCMA